MLHVERFFIVTTTATPYTSIRKSGSNHWSVLFWRTDWLTKLFAVSTKMTPKSLLTSMSMRRTFPPDLTTFKRRNSSWIVGSGSWIVADGTSSFPPLAAFRRSWKLFWDYFQISHHNFFKSFKSVLCCPPAPLPYFLLLSQVSTILPIYTISILSQL